MGGLSAKSAAKNLLDADVQVPGFRRSEGSVQVLLNKYIPSVTILGGIVIGLLASCSDVLNVFGSGIGILLMVDILVNYHNLLVKEQVDIHMPKLAAFLVESRKRVVAIVVGIAGVGKSTVISRAAELLSQKNTKATIIVFGTLMFEESKKMGLKNRDEMRKLSIEDQHLLQDIAAKRIAQMNEEILIIDTHMFINTTEGYYPGIPSRLLEILKPSYLIMIAADPAEIVRRRTTDNTRDRDIVSLENIRNELEISKAMVATSSVLTGSPFILIANDNGMIDNAASTIVNVLAKGS